jgi:hypothetical protein
LLSAILFSQALVAQTQQQPQVGEPPAAPAPRMSAPEGRLAFATPHALGEDSTLTFSLDRAQYALGWTNHVATSSGVAGAGEKMLAVFFSVENGGTEEVRFRDSTLEFLAIDEQGVVHERAAPMEIRTARLTSGGAPADQSIDDTLLRPGEPLSLFTAILVPSRLRVDRLVVREVGRKGDELVFPLAGRIGQLPQGFQDGHPEVVHEEIEVGAGQYLPAPSFDIRVEAAEVTDDPSRVGRRGEVGSQHWALLRLSVRNRAAKPQRFSTGNFRETRLIDTGDAWYAPDLLLHATRPERFRPRIDPGQTGTFILAFRLNEAVTLRSLRLQVGDAGKLSHRYLVGLGGGPRLNAAGEAPVAPGVLYLGRYVAVMDAPVIERDWGALGVPQAEPEPEPESESESESEPDAEQAAAAAMPVLSRAEISLNSIEGWDVAESDGDEPYLMVWTFRGTLSPDGYGTGLVVLESRMVTLGNTGFLSVGGVPYAPNSQQFRDNFPYRVDDVQPYELYGIVVTLAEADSSSHDSRRAFGQRLGRAMDTVLRGAAANAPQLDPTDASLETQRAYLERVKQTLTAMRGVGIDALFSATAGDGFGNSDDYLGSRVYAGVHLPALGAGNSVFSYTSVMRSSVNWSELITAGSNMGISFPYDLQWRHTVVP